MCSGAVLGFKARLKPRAPLPVCASSVLGCALVSPVWVTTGGDFSSQGTFGNIRRLFDVMTLGQRILNLLLASNG